MDPLASYLVRLEYNLMAGSGRWVADFAESLRDVEIGGVPFAVYLRGQTRAEGLFLSRIVSFFVLPNYRVACLVYTGDLPLGEGIRPVVQAALHWRQQQDLRWAWLVCARAGGHGARVRRQVEHWDGHDLGIALVDVASGEVVTSPTYLGRAMLRHVGPRK